VEISPAMEMERMNFFAGRRPSPATMSLGRSVAVLSWNHH
jgi:hypothetical protein